jgi:hypothetical protein
LGIQTWIAGTNSGHLEYFISVGFSFRPIPAGCQRTTRTVMLASVMFRSPDEVEKLLDLWRHSLPHGGTRRSIDKNEKG